MTWLVLFLSFFLILLLFLGFWICVRLFLLFNYNLQKVKVKNKVQIESNKIILRDGEILDSYLRLEKTSNVFLVFFHGFGAHLHEFNWLKKHCKDNGYSLLLPSRRHSGKNLNKSNSKYNLGIEVHDFYDIFNQVKKLFPNYEIVVLGHSLGASILAKCISWKKTQKLNLKFVLINSPSNFKSMSPFIFIKNNWKGFLSFLFGFLVKSNVYLEIDPKNYSNYIFHCSPGCNNRKLKFLYQLIKKKQPSIPEFKKYLTKYNLHLRKFPLYYFANFWSIFYFTYHNLSKNRSNLIWVVQGGNDYFANFKWVQKKENKLKTHKNINFLHIPDFAHGFNFEDDFSQNIYFINLILKSILTVAEKKQQKIIM